MTTTVRNLPLATEVKSTDYLLISQGGIDKRIPVDTLLASLGALSPFEITPTENSSTERTIGISDRNAYIDFTNSSLSTATIEPSADSPWVIGNSLVVRRGGTGDVIVVGGANVTINPSSSGVTLTEVGQAGQLIYKGNNIWDFLTSGAA